MRVWDVTVKMDFRVRLSVESNRVLECVLRMRVFMRERETFMKGERVWLKGFRVR